MKVAVVKTGPGVNCPMATASISWLVVIAGILSINSISRKASKTYPLPYKTEPIFKKIRKILVLFNFSIYVVEATPKAINGSGIREKVLFL